MPTRRSSAAARWRRTPLAAALATLLAAPARAEDPAPDGIELRQAPVLQPAPRGEAARKLPIILQAQTLTGRPDLDTVAEGNAEFRRGGTVIRADRLVYQAPDDLAIAKGNVRISRDGNIYTGPELQLKVQRFEGFFLNPTYRFSRIGAGGAAQRVDFLDEQRAVASRATYTSCPSDGSGTPAWLLSTDRVQIDFANNEGIADRAVLRFYGLPILAAPRLSFPLTDARKSGWLPPNFDLDTKSGLQFSMPYYWDIAPNRDATFTPLLSTRRGAGLESEFRYLEPGQRGEVRLNLLPFDQLTNTTRYALTGSHQSEFAGELRAQLRVLRVSDKDYWKDFPRDLASLTPRLLASDFELTRPFGDDWNGYARVQRWQVLQTVDNLTRIEAPYERVPQIGARTQQTLRGGFEVSFVGEFNRFTNPTDSLGLLPDPVAPATSVVRIARPTGSRLHALGSLSRPFVTPGWAVTPKVAFNAASYSLDQPLTDGRTSASRVIPTVSLDSSWVLERDARFFGRNVRQTLEPRLLYVNTPLRLDQKDLPNFDSSAKDFNFDSIFSESAFSGVDRVSDAHQLTAGVTTRVLDPATGGEVLRLGLAQRYLFRNQVITPTVAGQTRGTSPVDELQPFTGVGPTLSQRFSDVLLLGSTTLVPSWALEASLQYSPDSKRLTRSIVTTRYSPGPYRTLSATYRMTRGLSEQVELGWQWPIYGPLPSGVSGRGGSIAGGGICQGSWYGVGRINYSTLEKRLIDSVVGLEYDAGCWIGRVVASRLSTGRSEATTRLSVQLELVGLSRLNLGSNPLQLLKDNIPGFRLLRDDRAPGPALNAYD